MNLIEEIFSEATFSVDENLSRMVDSSVKSQRDIDSRPEHYFYLTELVNPINAYWERNRSDVERPIQLAKLLALGSKLHRISGIWFRRLPDFVTEEARLDGAYVGITGIVGKIDYRIGDGIVEFKTKPEQVFDVDIIFNNYPQDLEQLLFYAVLASSEKYTHYLVFMLDKAPYPLTAFKVQITDKGVIKSYLINRRDTLRKAIDEENPKYLKRCRYYDFNCTFQGNGICSCSTQEEANLDSIKKAIDISRDESFEKLLNEAKEMDETKMDEVFPVWSLLMPRKWFIQTVLGENTEYVQDIEKQLTEILLSTAIFNNRDLRLDKNEIKKIKNSELDIPIRAHNKRFIKIKSSSSKTSSTELVPYTFRSIKGKPRKLNNYYVAELGISCANFGKSKGVIFLLYPDVENSVIAYSVRFNNLEMIQSRIKKTLKGLFIAKKDNKLDSLDKCPIWMCENCQLDSYCES